MEFIILEDSEIVVNNERILLEKGDKIMLEGDANIEQLKTVYKKAVADGDTEKASEIAVFLDGIGVSLD